MGLLSTQGGEGHVQGHTPLVSARTRVGIGGSFLCTPLSPHMGDQMKWAEVGSLGSWEATFPGMFKKMDIPPESPCNWRGRFWYKVVVAESWAPWSLVSEPLKKAFALGMASGLSGPMGHISRHTGHHQEKAVRKTCWEPFPFICISCLCLCLIAQLLRALWGMYVQRALGVS